MQRRLYFLLPDLETTHTVVENLKREHVTEDNMYVVAQDNADTRDLPEAGIAETSDIAGSAGRGAAAGSVTGVLAGLTAIVFPPAGVAVGGGVVAATGLAGAGFGAWVASMIGIRHDNTQVQGYENAIKDGQVLMMVDVDDGRADQIRTEVKQAHADVVIENTHPHQPTA